MEKKKKREQRATRGVVVGCETLSSFMRCSRRFFVCAYG